MTPNKLSAGLYRLSTPVSNVSRDRRERHDWRRTTETFSANDEFIVEVADTRNLKDMGVDAEAVMFSIRLKGSRFSHQKLTIWAHEKHDDERASYDKDYRLLWALLPHLERTGEVPLSPPDKDDFVAALRKLREACVESTEADGYVQLIAPTRTVFNEIDALLARL